MLSVIIPTKDKADRLLLTLACLAAQTIKDQCEFIVINNGATDHTCQIIADAQQYIDIRTVNLSKPGRSLARNAGAREARGEFLVFIDDDILVPPIFLALHYQHQCQRPGLIHGKLRDLPLVARMVNPQNVDQKLAEQLFSVKQLRKNGFRPLGQRLIANALEQLVEKMHFGEIPWVAFWLCGAGANLSIPKLYWKEVGEYCEAFGAYWGCEDLEFAFRVNQSGLPIYFLPEAWGVHLMHQRTTRWEEHDINFKQFYALHPVKAVEMLPFLLGPTGSPKRYLEQLLPTILS